MKKTTKGALAAGAAAVLLAGGAGTYAAWSSDGAAVGGDVTAGHLRIEQVAGTGAWHWGTETAVGAALGDNETIVPGDKVVYVAEYKLDIKGTNLAAKAETTGTASVDDVASAPAGLKDELIVGTPAATSSGVQLDNLSEANTGITVQVATPVTFDPKNNEANQAGMDGKASLTNVGVVLKQSAPATAP